MEELSSYQIELTNIESKSLFFYVEKKDAESLMYCTDILTKVGTYLSTCAVLRVVVCAKQ